MGAVDLFYYADAGFENIIYFAEVHSASNFAYLVYFSGKRFENSEVKFDILEEDTRIGREVKLRKV
jgi:hypothetical protein